MAHKVIVVLPYRELGNSDIKFRVEKNGQMVGRLLISKGNVEWRSKNKQIGKKFSWESFDELVRREAKRR